MSTRLPLHSKAIRPKFENKRAIFGDDDDEVDDVRDERVIGFEDNKIKEAEPKKKDVPLIIPSTPNVDWRASAKHKKELFVPERAQQMADTSASQQPEVLSQNGNSFGLQIQKKEKVETSVSNDDVQAIVSERIEETTISKIEESQKTLEERAVEAIIKESKGEDLNESNDTKIVIPADETLVFRDDVKNRPDETTMDDYERIPVDEFGAALLRGLGWKEGDGIGRNRKNTPAPSSAPVQQREALLGLGAKGEQLDFKSDQERVKHRRSAYEYKDTSLFKKIAKRKLENMLDESDNGSSSNNSRSRSYSSSRSSSRNHDDYRSTRRRSRSRSSDRHRSSSNHSSKSRHRHRHSRSRSRSPISRSYSSSSSSSSKHTERSSSRR
ncbi:MAG: DExH-box splicing factor binding site-domain-containing protein [Benjaminiella poitrasii]|nr:MAG: DExH-box splicing factor binding site-domain-containing protein [Benjaminiella poitrasii]